MELGQPSGRLRRLQWISLLLATGAIAINYMDRATIAIGNLPIRQEFHLSATAMGGLLSAWSLAFALSQLPTGFLIDRVGARFLLGVALCIWSLAQAAAGFVGNYSQLVWARVMLGIGEAPAFPTATRVTSNWFRREERGLPTGIYNAAGSIGPAIAPPLLTIIMLAFGWRAMFIAMGVVGLIGAAIWFLVYREPEHSRLSDNDYASITVGETQPNSSVTLLQWGRLFKSRTMWGLILGCFGSGYGNWMYQAWLPAYLEMQQHLSIGKTGLVASIPFACGIIGAIGGGYISDLMVRRGFGVVRSRRLPSVLGLLGVAVFTTGAALSTSALPAVACITLSMFCSSVGGAAHWALITAVAPKKYTASAASIQNCGSYIGATCSPILTGLIVDLTGSFFIALLIGAAVAVVCAGFYQFLVRKPIDLEDLEGVALPGLSPTAAE
jgi:MFS family permease